MLNIQLLEDTMKAQGVSNSDMYTALGIDESTWYRKKKSPEKFTIGDIEIMAAILGCSYDVNCHIFLHPNSQKCEKSNE